jgi:hypothetical protein
MSSVMSSTHEGYMGPMNSPTRTKHTMAPTSEGTNQMIKWRARQMAELRASARGQKGWKRGKERGID